MRVSCVNSLDEIKSPVGDLIVFPEYSDLREILRAAKAFPFSIIVGAVQVGRRSRGYVIHRGRNRIFYLKILDDGRTDGNGNYDQLPIYEVGDICLGVVICRDIEAVQFWLPMADKIRRCTARWKFLVIPADMGSQWFAGEEIHGSNFDGLYVIVSNHPSNHEQRCKSFIADDKRRKILSQSEVEAISLVLG
jgi:predicted amidohydrolase